MGNLSDLGSILMPERNSTIDLNSFYIILTLATPLCHTVRRIRFIFFLTCCCILWQYGLWSFQTGYIELERFLPKNQHTHRRRKYEGISPDSYRPISYFGSIWELYVLDLKT